MGRLKNNEFGYNSKYEEEIAKYKIMCKCGRKVFEGLKRDKQLCDWCGNYVYRNKQAEFKDKMKKRLNQQMI